MVENSINLTLEDVLIMCDEYIEMTNLYLNSKRVGDLLYGI